VCADAGLHADQATRHEAASPLGHATTSRATRSRQPDRDPRRGTSLANINADHGYGRIAFLRDGALLVFDLKNVAQRARLQPLVKRADVIVEQFRPGVMKRLRLDYDSVAKLNPMVVYCSISGYGQSGLKRDVAAHDLNYIGDAGLLALSMGDLCRPVVPPAADRGYRGGRLPRCASTSYWL
jgi:crotonobetainyl-CoA:carnitine CoA-transferase CaiB-like acyl-CoA transferase